MKKTLLVITLGLLISCSQKSSEEHLAAAKQYIEQNNIEAAVVELKNAVQLDPKSANARFELGKVYLAQKDFEGAEKELNRAMEYGYSAGEVIPLISKAYKRTGAYAALSELDHKEKGLTPVEEAEVGFFKLQSLVQLDKQEEARALIEELQQLDTQSVYKSLSAVYVPILDKDYQKAQEMMASAKKQSPLNADVLRLQGQLHLQLGNRNDAADVYQQFVTQYPEDNQTLFVLAKLLVDNGKLKEAEPHVDKLLEIGPDNGLLNQLKATILAAREDHKEAQVFAEKSITNGRTDPVVRLLAGFSAYQNKDYEGANRHLSYIASSLPDGHPGLKLLAASQLQIGQSEEAGDILGRIGQVSEDDAMLFSKTGYELIRSGNYKQAKELVERTSDISRSADDLTRLGVLQLSLNDVQGIVNLEEAVEQAPQMVSAKSTLATAYLATNQLDKAGQLAVEWKQSLPDDVNGYMLAGEVLVKQSKYVEAKAEYNKVLQLEPDHTLAQLALVNIDLNQGNNAVAEAALGEILKKDPASVPALATFYIVKRKQDKHEEGLEPVIAALAASPQNEALAVLLGRMYLSVKDWDNALSALSNIEPGPESSAEFFDAKGQALLRSNKVNDAEAHYDTWLSLFPSAKQAVLGKLLLLDSQNKFSQGLDLSKAFLAKRDDIQLDLLNTHFLIMTGDYKQAREAYDRTPDKLLELPFVKGFEAKLLLSEGKAADALPFAKAAYEGLPNSRNLIVYLNALELTGQDKQGFDLLQNHVQQKPTDLAAKMLLAERQISSDENQAIATYEDSLTLNPNNFVVLNNLAYLYMQGDRLDEAKQHALKAVEIRPENAAALDTLAQILVAQNDYEAALVYYDRAINDEMKNEEIYLNYIETLLVAEKSRLARRYLKQRTLKDEASKIRLSQLKEKYGM